MLWRVRVDGSRQARVPVPFRLNPNYQSLELVRFDVHPDGRRLVLEALESYEADIGTIENVR